MPEGEPPQKHVNIRFDSADYDLIAELAHDDDRPVGAWVRHQALKAAKQRRMAKYGMTVKDIQEQTIVGVADDGNVVHDWERKLNRSDVSPIPKEGK